MEENVRIYCEVSETGSSTAVRGVELCGYGEVLIDLFDRQHYEAHLGLTIRVHAEATWVFDVMSNDWDTWWWHSCDTSPRLVAMEVDGLRFDLNDGNCGSEHLLCVGDEEDDGEIRRAARRAAHQFMVAIRAARLFDTFRAYSQSLMPEP